MMTFLAPPSRCRAALSLEVKIPVDSITTSTPRSPHGRSAGLRSERTLIFWPSTDIPSRVALTLASRRPCTESLASRNAIVWIEPKSLTATNSIGAFWARAALKKLRPIRPKPFTPTRTVMALSPPGALRAHIRRIPALLADHEVGHALSGVVGGHTPPSCPVPRLSGPGRGA